MCDVTSTNTAARLEKMSIFGESPKCTVDNGQPLSDPAARVCAYAVIQQGEIHTASPKGRNCGEGPTSRWAP